MAKKPAPRPKTPNRQAIEAIESLLLLLLARLARSSKDDFLEALQNGFIAFMQRRPPKDEAAKMVVEHADWLLGRAQAMVRKDDQS